MAASVRSTTTRFDRRAGQHVSTTSTCWPSRFSLPPGARMTGWRRTATSGATAGVPGAPGALVLVVAFRIFVGGSLGRFDLGPEVAAGLVVRDETLGFVCVALGELSELIEGFRVADGPLASELGDERLADLLAGSVSHVGP